MVNSKDISKVLMILDREYVRKLGLKYNDKRLRSLSLHLVSWSNVSVDDYLQALEVYAFSMEECGLKDEAAEEINERVKYAESSAEFYDETINRLALSMARLGYLAKAIDIAERINSPAGRATTLAEVMDYYQLSQMPKK